MKRDRPHGPLRNDLDGRPGSDRISRTSRILSPIVLAICTASAGNAQSNAAPTYAPGSAIAPIARSTIDTTVARAMATFNIPGVAVAVVQNGEVVFAKGYGVRETGRTGRVDVETIFQIGSNTKTFTAAALAMLVDEGRIHWDDKVIDHLPDFRMQDPYVTREFTVRDLLTHRSGLGPGAGDLMFFPETDMSRKEVMHGLRHLTPVSGFREKFAYDNLLYMVAGEVVAAASGRSWEEFVEGRLLTPLGMKGCAARYDRLGDRKNVAAPHVVVAGQIKAVPVVGMNVVAAAGTINCSASGMARWLIAQLAGGVGADGKHIFSTARRDEMWTMNTIMPVSPLASTMRRTHFSGYGLGWFLSDVQGYKMVAHNGGVLGTVTFTAMIPELDLGVIVLTNQQSVTGMEAVGSQIVDAYLGAPRRDWVELAVAHERASANPANVSNAAGAEATRGGGQPALPLKAYVGTYQDPWRGSAAVRLEEGRLVLKISRTRSLEGALSAHDTNTFIVRWKDRSLEADAYVRFEQDFDGTVGGMTMQAISPATDFSFDFQDLHFRRVAAPATAAVAREPNRP